MDYSPQQDNHDQEDDLHGHVAPEDSPVQPQPRPKLPPHLRERRIVAKPATIVQETEQTPASNMATMFPMVSPMSNLAMMHYMNNPMVANTNPMLPYMMMPQQPSYSNPNMNQ